MSVKPRTTIIKADGPIVKVPEVILEPAKQTTPTSPYLKLERIAEIVKNAPDQKAISNNPQIYTNIIASLKNELEAQP